MKKVMLVMPLMALFILTNCGGGSPNPKAHLTFGALGYKLMNNGKDFTNGIYNKGETVEFKLSVNPDYLDYVTMPSLVYITTADGSVYPNYTYNEINGELSIIANEDVSISAFTVYKEDLPTFEECSWAEIDRISKLGIADRIFKVGDIKVLKDYNEGNGFKEDIKVRIMDFNHDDLADGSGKAGISLEFANLPTFGPNKWYPYDELDHDNLNFPETDLNKRFLNSETEPDMFLTSIPEELRKAIKPVIKYTSVGENYDLSTYVTKGFILSYSECLEDMSPAEARYEGDIYKIYKGHSEKIWRETPGGESGVEGRGMITRSPVKWGSALYHDTCLYKGVWATYLLGSEEKSGLQTWDIGIPGSLTYAGGACGVVCFCI